MRKQKGFTFWSLTFTIGTIAIIAMLTVKLFPAYSEFFSVKKVMNRLASEGNLSAMDKTEIQRAFERSSNIDDIHSIEPKDLDIHKTPDGDTVVTADYEVVIPLVANISALLKFHASTEKAPSGKAMP
jgi:Tfp pilus assembly major pilin PilA